MKTKVFNDIVHGHMEFHPLIVSIIDTPQFQRLRNIKQTGPCFFVYPGAIHTRFEHSLGTCFLAGKLMDILNEKRGMFDGEIKKEALSLQIAGLCHDLGHGPFSHTWEIFLNRCGINWKHEEASVEIFDRLLNEEVPDKEETYSDWTKCSEQNSHKISVFDLFKRYDMDKYINKIKEMIRGENCQDRTKSYLYQIICNKSNGVDVDKWDYLMRDSKMVNVPIHFDCDRITKFCQILETSRGTQEICFRDKECSMVIDMFEARGLLHDKVYQHIKVKLVEEMILDAFYLAKERLNLTSTNPDNILRLTDHIYYKIAYDDFEGEEDMMKAKKILTRLHKRNLYTCIAVKVIGENDVIPENKELEDIIYESLKRNDRMLQRNLITCGRIVINLTNSDRNQHLQGIMAYRKETQAEMSKRPSVYDISEYYELKPNSKVMKRVKLFIIYKGEDKKKYFEYSHNALLAHVLNLCVSKPDN